MSRILCIEDSQDTALIIQAALPGHLVILARLIQEAERLIAKESFDLFLVDIELPDGSGLEFIARLPENLKSQPFFILTAKGDITSKVTAFSLGADDFIKKPFDPLELRLRVESRLRKKSSGSTMTVGDLIISPDDQRVSRAQDNRAIDLTTVEFRLLMLLAKRPGKIFSREEILDRVWTNAVAVTDRTVDVHVSNLRRKLADSLIKIETVIGAGYRLQISPKTDQPS